MEMPCKGRVGADNVTGRRSPSRRRGGREARLARSGIREHQVFSARMWSQGPEGFGDDDCFDDHSWRNNVIVAFGTLSSFGVASENYTCIYMSHDVKRHTIFLIRHIIY